VPPAALTNANTATARYHAIAGLASDVCNIRAFELMRFITPPPTEKRSIVMTVSVCLCVCLSVRDHIFETARPIFTNFRHITYGRGSVLLWRRSDMLRTSGFMDDVKSAHKPMLLDVAARLRRVSRAALGLAINGA